MSDFPDGIIFGLPDADYHAIPRLSTSGIKTICVSPLDFWFDSWLNPEREPDTDTPAKKLGRAYHKLLLEGDAAFDAAYAVAPSKEDHPDALDGAEALKAKCDELGLKKSGRIADLCERIREASPDIELWLDIMSAFSAKASGRELLTKAQWLEIQRVRFVLNHMPNIKGAFTGGFPEVTLLWTDKQTGIPMKARLDYLKPRAGAAAILDVKSFGNVMGRPLDEIPETEIARNDYFVQPVAYTSGRAAVSALWRKHGREIVRVVSGPEPSDEWLASVLEPERVAFNFVFVQTGGVPNIIACEFSEGDSFGGLGWQSHAYWSRGHAEYRFGIGMFSRCMNQYGADVPWIIQYPVRKLRDEGFPVWALTKATPFIDDEAAA